MLVQSSDSALCSKHRVPKHANTVSTKTLNYNDNWKPVFKPVSIVEFQYNTRTR